MRRLVEETLKRYPWLAPRYLLADKGYDSTENFVWLDSIGITPIIAVRKPRKKKGSKRATYDVVRKGEFREYESSYTKEGYPLCAGDKAMEYVGSDAERGHLFRCQDGGCALKKKQTLFSLFCSDEQWEKPEGALLRVIGKIPRFSQKWKQLYKLRQTIERFFGQRKAVAAVEQEPVPDYGQGGHACVTVAAELLGDHAGAPDGWRLCAHAPHADIGGV